MATILRIIQDVCDEVGLERLSAVVMSADPNARQLLALAHDEGIDLRRFCAWPELTKEHTFNTVSSTEAYALPTAFDEQHFETHWNRSNFWPVYGPLSPQEWQYIKSGLATSSVYQRFRIKGATSLQFYLDPIPSAAETVVFEYQSKNWCRPMTWAATTSFSAACYVWYNGNIYFTVDGGTSGSTPPTHTSGSVSDGGVTWAYQDIVYERFLKDADEPILDSQIVKLGIKWRYLLAKGLDYTPFKMQWTSEIKKRFASVRGARTINVGMGRSYGGPSLPSVREGSWSI